MDEDRRPWTKAENQRLRSLVKELGDDQWTAVGNKMEGRTAKQCRERWRNNLNPKIQKRPWSHEEDEIIIKCHQTIGSKWSEISKQLPGRADNQIKNRWNSTLRRVARYLRQEEEASNPAATRKKRRGARLTAKDEPLFQYCMRLLQTDPNTKVNLPTPKRKNKPSPVKQPARGTKRGRDDDKQAAAEAQKRRNWGDGSVTSLQQPRYVSTQKGLKYDPTIHSDGFTPQFGQRSLVSRQFPTPVFAKRTLDSKGDSSAHRLSSVQATGTLQPAAFRRALQDGQGAVFSRGPDGRINGVRSVHGGVTARRAMDANPLVPGAMDADGTFSHILRLHESTVGPGKSAGLVGQLGRYRSDGGHHSDFEDTAAARRQPRILSDPLVGSRPDNANNSGISGTGSGSLYLPPGPLDVERPSVRADGTLSSGERKAPVTINTRSNPLHTLAVLSPWGKGGTTRAGGVPRAGTNDITHPTPSAGLPRRRSAGDGVPTPASGGASVAAAANDSTQIPSTNALMRVSSQWGTAARRIEAGSESSDSKSQSDGTGAVTPSGPAGALRGFNDGAAAPLGTSWNGSTPAGTMWNGESGGVGDSRRRVGALYTHGSALQTAGVLTPLGEIGLSMPGVLSPMANVRGLADRLSPEPQVTVRGARANTTNNSMPVSSGGSSIVDLDKINLPNNLAQQLKERLAKASADSQEVPRPLAFLEVDGGVSGTTTPPPPSGLPQRPLGSTFTPKAGSLPTGTPRVLLESNIRSGALSPVSDGNSKSLMIAPFNPPVSVSKRNSDNLSAASNPVSAGDSGVDGKSGKPHGGGDVTGPASRSRSSMWPAASASNALSLQLGGPVFLSGVAGVLTPPSVRGPASAAATTPGTHWSLLPPSTKYNATSRLYANSGGSGSNGGGSNAGASVATTAQVAPGDRPKTLNTDALDGLAVVAALSPRVTRRA